VELLAEILRGTPRLAEAACTDHPADKFDATEPVDAVEALEICAVCPCLEVCRKWAESQARGRLSGVVAGEIYRPRPPVEAKRKKKPRRPKPTPRPAAVPA
jgi:hypothetical protein